MGMPSGSWDGVLMEEPLIGWLLIHGILPGVIKATLRFFEDQMSVVLKKSAVQENRKLQSTIML